MTPQQELRIFRESMESGGDAWTVLRVHGEPRSFNIEPLHKILGDEASVPRCRIRVRFEDARMADSGLIGVLIETHKRVTRAGGSFRCEFEEGLARELRRIFKVQGDDDWLAGMPARTPNPPGPRRDGRAEPLG